MSSVEERIRRFEEASGWNVFAAPRGKDCPGAFRFTIPGVMIGGDDITLTREFGQWALRWFSPDGNAVYVGRNDDLTLAYLDLIARRMGTNGVIERPSLLATETRFGEDLPS